MEDKKIQEIMKTEYHKMTQGPGLYQLNTAPTLPQSVLPFSPTLISQRGGVSTVNNVSLVDIDSDLMNINRKFTLDPNKKYSPDENKDISFNHKTMGGFNIESSLLNNPPMELRGKIKNRWEEPCIDPQKNAIEPFKFRQGLNTYLSLIDSKDTC